MTGYARFNHKFFHHILPMDKTSTPQLTSPRRRTSMRNDKQATPKPSTVEFLRQFARAYTFEPCLGCALGNIIAN